MSDLIERAKARCFKSHVSHGKCLVCDLADEIERLLADCKEKDRTIETQQQYLDNKDSVIKGMNEMITKLEDGTLNKDSAIQG